ncbi:MAG TPA: glycosyltransferase family 2 protein [Candidatus Paceibacterota bacterium]|nr:glycosyltransferase family 2 protein [Candidatus Paceibacterota bacterium]
MIKIKKGRISIGVPCYNEEKIIKENYLKIKKEAEKLPGKNYEILFVNDGSKDKTEEILKEIEKKDKKVKVISYFPNRGMGYGHRQIYNNSTGEITIIMDADLSTPPSTMFPMIKTLQEDKVDVVLASRYVGIKAKIPFFRWLPSWTYYLINRILFNFKVRDSQTGFVAYRSSAIKSIDLKANKFDIHVEVLAKLKKKGYKMKEIPAEYTHRTEDAKFSVLKDGPKTLLDTFRVWRNLKKGL